MAKIKVLGDTLMIVSEVKEEGIKKIKRYMPEALALHDLEGNETFKIQLGMGAISNYGVSFPSTDSDGYPFVSTDNVILGRHEDMKEEKEKIIDKYAMILNNINCVEKQINDLMAAVNKCEIGVQDSIEIIGEDKAPNAKTGVTAMDCTCENDSVAPVGTENF